MKSTIFIPKKIKVGFNLRSDTYTGKLGYVIYHDGKVWRKETSWESWRQKEGEKRFSHYEKKEDGKDDYNKRVDVVLGPEINPLEFDNIALEGFVLNKKVGGYKSDWNFRQAYCRVYDPRGFEFEITIPNLLYILENANSIKGKGLEGKFIYGWDAKDLVLLPEEAPEYKEMVEFTETLALKVSKKDLKVGGIYITASGDKVTYLTESLYYDYNGATEGNKKLWFYRGGDGYVKVDNIDISVIKKYVGDNPEVANLFTELEKNDHYKPKEAMAYKYEPYTVTDFPNVSSSYYSRTEVYIPMKGKNKYKKVYLYENRYDNTYYLQNGRGGESITEGRLNKKALIEKYPIYKQIKIVKDEN
jgi:hypothetical protein